MSSLPELFRCWSRFCRYVALGSLLAVLTVSGGWGGGGSALAAPGAYVEGLEDLPLMPGLEAVPGETLVFDKPGGRIVQSTARGQVSAQEVRRFYRDTVPQLGWHLSGTDRFVKAGEVLRLEFRGKRPLTVRFILSPE